MMRTVSLSLCAALASLLSLTTALADVWDTSGASGTFPRNDDTPDTHNELVHGSDQLHDLGARPGLPNFVPDQDWYRITSQPWSSYEVVVDATAGDIGQPSLQLWNAAGSVILASASAVGGGFTMSLRWQNTTTNPVEHRVRVMSGFCTSDCGADDVYRIRSYETTYSVARFNNFDPQVTVLVIQNAAAYPIVSPHIYLWSPTGTLLADYVVPPPWTFNPKNLLTLNTAGLAPGVGGSITISNLARYGDLSGKAVAIEADNGLAFDTPMEPRPH